MRKIAVSEFVTLDGVMEAPGGEPVTRTAAGSSTSSPPARALVHALMEHDLVDEYRIMRVAR